MTRSIVIYSFVSVTKRSRDSLVAILVKKIQPFEGRENIEFKEIGNLVNSNRDRVCYPKLNYRNQFPLKKI